MLSVGVLHVEVIHFHLTAEQVKVVEGVSPNSYLSEFVAVCPWVVFRRVNLHSPSDELSGLWQNYFFFNPQSKKQTVNTTSYKIALVSLNSGEISLLPTYLFCCFGLRSPEIQKYRLGMIRLRSQVVCDDARSMLSMAAAG